MRLRTAFAALMLLLGAGLAHAERVVVSIDKNAQRMTVSVDGQEEYVWPVSTGAAGYTTPSGTYRPFRMEEYHFSEEWDDAPMPNSIFFTPQGHAIHGSEHVDRLGHRASHGCVRLAPEDAETLFYLVEEAGMANTTVIVRGGDAKKGKRQRGRRWMRSPDWMFDYSEGY
jgi:lipoprotein-anchoring transpeptidase ErfK/SrfK